MSKKNKFEDFLRRLEEAINTTQDNGAISYRPIFVDISINICPNTMPEEIAVKRPENIPVDILETEKKIHALASLPEMEKESIKLSCNGRVLEITASNAVKTVNETIELPAKVVKKGMKATFENGILEVIFNKSKKSIENSNA